MYLHSDTYFDMPTQMGFELRTLLTDLLAQCVHQRPRAVTNRNGGAQHATSSRSKVEMT